MSISIGHDCPLSPQDDNVTARYAAREAYGGAVPIATDPHRRPRSSRRYVSIAIGMVLDCPRVLQFVYRRGRVLPRWPTSRRDRPFKWHSELLERISVTDTTVTDSFILQDARKIGRLNSKMSKFQVRVHSPILVDSI